MNAAPWRVKETTWLEGKEASEEVISERSMRVKYWLGGEERVGEGSVKKGKEPENTKQRMREGKIEKKEGGFHPKKEPVRGKLQETSSVSWTKTLFLLAERGISNKEIDLKNAGGETKCQAVALMLKHLPV